MSERALPGETRSGDLHLVTAVSDSAVVAVIDALGHGPEANEAARRAVAVLTAACATVGSAASPPSLQSLFDRCHAALRFTRGVVMTIVSIDGDGQLCWVANDGAEALDYLLADDDLDRACTPAIVLLDLNLPKINGIDVLKRIRNDPRTRLQPVVILTSSREEQDLISSYANGANSYIRKPVDFNHFVDAVRQLALYWLMLNEPPQRAVHRP